MIRRSRVASGLAFLLVGMVACAPEAPDPPDSQPAQSLQGRSEVSSELSLDSALVLAEAMYLSLDHAAAREMFRSLLGRARSAGDAAAEAKALTGLGLVEYNLAEDYQEARRLLLESLEVKRAHGLTDQLFASYNGLGLLAYWQNRFPDAAAHLNEAIRLGAEGGEVGQVATARMNLALVQTEWGDFRAAREGFLAMRDTMAEFGEHFEGPDRAFRMGAALTNLGMLDVRVGNPAAAVEWLLEAVDVFRDGNPAGVSYPMGHLATAYSLLGDQSRAFAVLDTALHQVRAQGLRQEEASNLEVLAEQYREAGDFRRALDLYDEAKEINAELGLTVETGADLRGEAEIHLALGAPERALAPAEEALTLHRQAGAALDALYDRIVLAETRDLLGNGEDVLQQLAAARDLADQLDVRSARVALALTEARIAERRSDPEAVLEVLGDASEDLARGGYAEQWQSHYLASRAHTAAGRADSAVAAGWRALYTVERLGS